MIMRERDRQPPGQVEETCQIHLSINKFYKSRAVLSKERDWSACTAVKRIKSKVMKAFDSD